MSYVGRGMLFKYLPKWAQNFVHNLQFRPGNPQLMEPAPTARQGLEGAPHVKGYRYPAPGSRDAPRIPRVESTDDVFDIKYYSRDTRRMPRNNVTLVNKKLLSTAELEALTAGPAEGADVPKIESSTGKFGNPAVKEYDPTGLRSSMTATHEALEASLNARTPNHLPRPEWWDDQEAIIAKYEALGIPVPFGRPMKWAEPPARKQASW